MSASIDNGPHDTDEDSREVLSTWLDDYIAGRCDRAKMHESFLQVCRSNPEAPWDALALLDQYQRRGRVDVALARSLKAEIAQLVFGVANQTEEPRQPEVTIDTTGSRWRKLYAERGSVNADKADDDAPASAAGADVTLHRAFVPPAGRATSPTPSRDFDPVTPPLTAIQNFDPPLTRPPPMSRPAAREPLQRGAEPARDAVVGIGTQLRDRYELMEVIGTGRSGTIYRAFDRHRSHLPSPSCYVAVRVLQLQHDHREAALARIEREAYESQSLSHPNIVSVFDLDRHLDVYFVVMELLEGERLSDILQRQAGKPLSRDRAFAIVSAVGAALTHAHQRNIAHGDLKPAAVIVTTHGEVKVTDFGFARSHALDQWVGGEPTVDGMSANSTAAYASAERVEGDEPSVRDDVYSFACMAYELLSGRHPFGGRSAPLARAHGRAAPKIAGLSARQWAALQNALSWSRDERRTDVAELVAVLGGVESATSLPPLPISRGHSAEKNLENPFGGGKGVVLAILLIAAVGGVAWWQWPRLIEPSSVSPVTAPAQADVERSPPAASDAPPAPQATSLPPTEVIETPKIAPPQNLDEAPASKKALGSPIVAATADPPSTHASGGAAQREQNAAQDARAQSSSPQQASASTNGAGKPASIEFDKDTYVATEGDAMVKLTVRRNGSTRGPAKFRWSLRANSAEPGTDYADLGPGVEEVPAGSRSMTLTIPLVTDVVAENTELFLVELQPVEGGAPIGEHSHAAVIIVDDD